MRVRAIFGESFLDGFTMSGFLDGLRRPGAPARLLEPAPEQSALSSRVFAMGADKDAEVALSGDIHRVPEAALRKMIALLERENEFRHSQLSPR